MRGHFKKSASILTEQETQMVGNDRWPVTICNTDISLIKNYSIAISIKIISSIHIFLKYSRFLGLTAIFDKVHLKMIESNFSFPEFAPVWKKSVSSICSVLSYSQF